MAEMKSNEASATKRPSMVDVARKAGVAHVTVSRVLNDHPSVKPETRERVLAAIDELGYQRNDMARALKRGRSSSLGLVLAGSQLYGLPEILLGVEQAATAAGYWVQMSSAQGSSAPKFTEAVNRLTGVATEGVAMIAVILAGPGWGASAANSKAWEVWRRNTAAGRFSSDSATGFGARVMEVPSNSAAMGPRSVCHSNGFYLTRHGRCRRALRNRGVNWN